MDKPVEQQQSAVHERLLTRREAAAALRLSLRALDYRVAEGHIRYVRLGNGPKAPIRFRPEDLRDYITANLRLGVDDAAATAKRMLAGRATR